MDTVGQLSCGLASQGFFVGRILSQYGHVGGSQGGFRMGVKPQGRCFGVDDMRLGLIQQTASIDKQAAVVILQGWLDARRGNE